MGGNGAPLVPIGDELLFSEFDACLNIGGFSNISFKKEGKRIAFDICPVNIILNQFAKNLGKDFDENGDLAKEGTVNFEILTLLNSLHFYETTPPKSLGIEWNIFSVLNNLKLNSENVEKAREEFKKDLAENDDTINVILNAIDNIYSFIANKGGK